MTKRALVVDDDRSMVRTLSDVLKLKGWEVETAYSGTEAVSAAANNGFDVVLMDIKMPGMDGVAAFKAMKRIKPDVRVVLMTAYAAQELIGEAEREGVLRVMPKPVDIASLLGLLSSALTLKRPVLIIDSDLDFLETLSAALTGYGYPTVVASNLFDAGTLIESKKPAAVLLHLHLKGPSGTVSPREAVAAVHSLSPAVSLILYGGRATDANGLPGVPADWVHAYLQKPFSVEKVAEVLDAADG